MNLSPKLNLENNGKKKEVNQRFLEMSQKDGLWQKKKTNNTSNTEI